MNFLSTWRGEFAGDAIVAQGDALVGADAQVGARFGGAEEDEPRFAVFGKISQRCRLVPLAPALHARGAGNAPALQAHGRQVETCPSGGGIQTFILADLKAGLSAIWQNESHSIRLHSNSPYGL